MTNGMGRGRRAAIAAAGVAATLGLYWDDAWHTDVGRDTFFSPPHLLLYGGIAVLLVAVATWAWRRFRAEGRAVLTDPTVALPLFGAAVALGSAPVDEAWHQLFGRDAVVWSPPHMVVVAGMVAFAAGLLLAARRGARGTSAVPSAVIGAFLVAAAGTVVMEFEADVPQFAVVWYLPVLVAALTFAFGLIDRAGARAWAVTAAAAAYVALRLAVVGFLAVLDHSLPTVMPTVAAALAFDVARRRSGRRWVIAAATASAAVPSHALAHLLQPAGLAFTVAELVVGLGLGVAVAWVALAATGVGAVEPAPGPGRRVRLVASCLLLAVVGLAGPAAAHDPGQGEEVAPVLLAASRQGERIDVAVEAGSCGGWTPLRAVARRAGRTHEAALGEAGACRFSAAVTVDDPGRWFVYVEVDVAGRFTEAWLPVEAGPQGKRTTLYVASREAPHWPQVVAGVLLYLLAVAILAAVVRAYRQAEVAAAPA